MFSLIKNFFQAQANDRDNSININDRKSADTKASSSQSYLQKKKYSTIGWTPQETIELFSELTEFEKIELGNYSRIYTVGNVRRANQYSIADKEGFYNTRIGE